MDVLQVLGSAGNGGAETYFIDLVTALARDGLSQEVALRRNPARLAALASANIPDRVFGFGGVFDWRTRPAVGRYARDGKARVIVAWMNRAARNSPPGPWARIGRLGGYYKLKNYRDFDCLVVNTPDIMAYLIREGWPAPRARYIPNFARARDEAALARTSFDTPAGAPLLLAMGRLHDAKAHDVSLRALALIPDAHLWIAGDGPEEAHLKALAGELGVAARVHFLGWRDDAGALYRAADLCLFPSRYEPLGNVVLQAWAHGLPIVAAASQGPADFIKDGEDGVLVPIDDPAALAGAARALLADAAARQRLAAAGLKRIEGEFSERAVLAQWRALFSRYGAA
jgi:glycosyltransferase involved in cell wall biosynthesis